jgi:cytochrome c-type biogenesis protein CcmH/NrfG
MVGRLTYGASKDTATKHFQTALKLAPDSAVAMIEYANALVMMHGKSKIDEATGLYQQAAICTAADAMEELDVALARSELED